MGAAALAHRVISRDQREQLPVQVLHIVQNAEYVNPMDVRVEGCQAAQMTIALSATSRGFFR